MTTFTEGFRQASHEAQSYIMGAGMKTDAERHQLSPDFEHGGICARFYRDARKAPCVEFSTRMGYPLGGYWFNDGVSPVTQGRFARGMCDVLAAMNQNETL